MRLKIINLAKVGSTNNFAFQLAEKGEKEVTVITAKEQTEGKGRGRKRWFSPAEGGIYASFILRPLNPLKEIAYLPLIFAAAAAKLLSKFIEVKIKLPNDVITAGKKICGVLVEARSLKQKAEFVVAGIGINVNASKAALPFSATSLYLETAKFYDQQELFKELAKEILKSYRDFKQGLIRELLKETFSFCFPEEVPAAFNQNKDTAFDLDKLMKDIVVLR